MVCAVMDTIEKGVDGMSAPKTLGSEGRSAILPPGSAPRFSSGDTLLVPTRRDGGRCEPMAGAAVGSGDRGARVDCLEGVMTLPPAADMLRRPASIMAAKLGLLLESESSSGSVLLGRCCVIVIGGPLYVVLLWAA